MLMYIEYFILFIMLSLKKMLNVSRSKNIWLIVFSFIFGFATPCMAVRLARPIARGIQNSQNNQDETIDILIIGFGIFMLYQALKIAADMYDKGELDKIINFFKRFLD